MAVRTISAIPPIEKHRISVPSRDDESKRLLHRDVFESALAIRTRRLEKMIYDVQQELKECQEAGNMDDALILLKKDKDLKERYSLLNQILGRIIPR